MEAPKAWLNTLSEDVVLSVIKIERDYVRANRRGEEEKKTRRDWNSLKKKSQKDKARKKIELQAPQS